MAHELTGALQQVCRIRQRCALKEPHIYVRSEYIHVGERRISQTCHRTAVMQKLPDFVPTISHYLKPLLRDASQFTCVLFHPRIDGGVPLDSTIESQQFRSHCRSTCFDMIFDLWSLPFHHVQLVIASNNLRDRREGPIKKEWATRPGSPC